MNNMDGKYIEFPKSPMMKVYTSVVVILPMISIYASGINGLTVGDIALVTMLLLCLLYSMHDKKVVVNKKAKPLFLLIVTIIITSAISVFLQSSNAVNMVASISTDGILIRIVRRSFYYAIVPLVSSKWFDYKQAKKLVQILGMAGTLFIILQYILYYGFHYILNGYLKFLPVYHENYMAQDYVSLYSTIFRPTGYLLEPAHMSRYMLIALVLLLFDKKTDSKFMSTTAKYSFVVTLGICLTTSGTGIMIAAVIWAIWLLSLLFTKHHKITPNMVGIVILLIVAFVILFRSSVVQIALFRVANTDLTNINTAGGARFRGFIQYFNLPTLFKVFGMGYGATPNTTMPTWFSGASYILFGTGIIGFAVCGYIFVKLFVTIQNPAGRVLLIVWGLLFAMDDSFMSHVAVVYFSFICFSDYKSTSRKRMKCARRY